MMRLSMRAAVVAVLSAWVVWGGGCERPLGVREVESLRDQIEAAAAETTQRAVAGEQADPTENIEPPKVERAASDDLPAERIEQIDASSGPGFYGGYAPAEGQESMIGVGLDRSKTVVVKLTLDEAVRLAVEHNLDLRMARLSPEISRLTIVEAEAVFDSIFFTDLSAEKSDDTRQRPVIGGFPVGTPTQVSDVLNLTTGIRKGFDTGAFAELSTGFQYTNNKTAGLSLDPDPAFLSNVSLSITQPLLRNFGRDVNRAQIRLARNALRRDRLELEARLLDVTEAVEAAYWELAAARYEVAVRHKTYGITLKTLETLKQREAFDASPVQLAQARLFADSRRGELIRAIRAYRQASDQLKALVRSPELPVTGEAILEPADAPMRTAIRYNLWDVAAAVRANLPSIKQAVLGIEDASIRMAVAENQKLPALDVSGGVLYQGLDDDLEKSYDELVDGRFISYLVGLYFETPLDNRGREAAARRARVERQVGFVAYQRALQDGLLAAKMALRNAVTEFQLIAVDRAARRSAADNLRAIESMEKAGVKLQPEFLLDLKLNTQKRLADAEVAEYRSMVNYNIALTNLNKAQGLLLRQRGIQMEAPDEEDPLGAEGREATPLGR